MFSSDTPASAALPALVSTINGECGSYFSGEITYENAKLPGRAQSGPRGIQRL